MSHQVLEFQKLNVETDDVVASTHQLEASHTRQFEISTWRSMTSCFWSSGCRSKDQTAKSTELVKGIKPTPICCASDDEAFFARFRPHIVGCEVSFEAPSGEQRVILYADWIASGRLFGPIAKRIGWDIGKYVANTHTETSLTGSIMTCAYNRAKLTIKHHVHAMSTDVLIFVGSGMTGCVNKLQRILGLRIPEQYRDAIQPSPHDRPVVFVTHMEHHSNQITWIETICEVVVVPPDDNGLVSLEAFESSVGQYADRPLKIAAITACSNITGIQTPYHDIARLMHREGGFCFVDFACSAPYVAIDMHPEDMPESWLDAIVFAPHKFLGGPGTSGVLIFNAKLYTLKVPDHPGGGTVKWTNPWGEHSYVDNIEEREDGGTPPFLGAIQSALCIKLKELMGVEKIARRERELLDILLPSMNNIEGVVVLAGHISDRLGVVSFYIEGLHYNLGVRLLNDKFGIQVRGGCACAGTYGHYLLNISKEESRRITDEIDAGDLSHKPGWVRISLHPTMTNAEVEYIASAVRDVAGNFAAWGQDYEYSPSTNDFRSRLKGGEDISAMVTALLHLEVDCF